MLCAICSLHHVVDGRGISSEKPRPSQTRLRIGDTFVGAGHSAFWNTGETARYAYRPAAWLRLSSTGVSTVRLRTLPNQGIRPIQVAENPLRERDRPMMLLVTTQR